MQIQNAENVRKVFILNSEFSKFVNLVLDEVISSIKAGHRLLGVRDACISLIRRKMSKFVDIIVNSRVQKIYNLNGQACSHCIMI